MMRVGYIIFSIFLGLFAAAPMAQAQSMGQPDTLAKHIGEAIPACINAIQTGTLSSPGLERLGFARKRNKYEISGPKRGGGQGRERQSLTYVKRRQMCRVSYFGVYFSIANLRVPLAEAMQKNGFTKSATHKRKGTLYIRGPLSIWLDGSSANTAVDYSLTLNR